MRADANELLQRIGETFGNAITELVTTTMTKTVTVVEVDEEFAYVTMYEEDEPLPVPLTFMGIPDGSVKVIPAVGSTANIVMVNGNENAPQFTSYSLIDSVAFTRGSVSVTLTVDPEDDSKDTINVAVGSSSVAIDAETIVMNEGKLDGLVEVGRLTDRLNKLEDEINQIQSNIASHTHLVATSGSPTSQTGSTTSTVYTNVPLTKFDNGDYENEKITQG